MGASQLDVTQLLKAWGSGDESALDKLTPLVYDHLHRVAQHHMADERSGHILQTTALLNEAYVRLFDCRQLDWRDRAHFFGVCAQLMRRILIDIARSNLSQKRGARAPHIVWEDAMECGHPVSADLLSLDDALRSLAKQDNRKSKVVELRFFGGLNVDETAEVLNISKETVFRDWRLAKSWLLRELSEGGHVGA